MEESRTIGGKNESIDFGNYRFMKRQKYIKTKSYPLVCNICILLLFVSMKSLYFQQVVCRTISCKFSNVQLCKMYLINLDRYFVIFL